MRSMCLNSRGPYQTCDQSLNHVHGVPACVRVCLQPSHQDVETFVAVTADVSRSISVVQPSLSITNYQSKWHLRLDLRLCFAIGSQHRWVLGVPTKTRLESRIKQFNRHFIHDIINFQASRDHTRDYTWSKVMTLTWMISVTKKWKKTCTCAYTARHGTELHCTAWYFTARHGTARHGTALCGCITSGCITSVSALNDPCATA